MNAQPLWEGLSVDKFYRENKEIYLQRFENGIKYFSDKKGRENNGLSQGQNTLIYKKDTNENLHRAYTISSYYGD